MQLVFRKLSGAPWLTDQCGVVCCHRNVNTPELRSLMSRDMEDSSWQEHGDLCHNDWCQHDYMTPGDWARPGTVRDISFKKLNIQVSVAVGGLVGCQGPRPVNETSLTVVVNNSSRFLSDQKYPTWELLVFTSPARTPLSLSG